jgi:hypothetical protein
MLQARRRDRAAGDETGVVRNPNFLELVKCHPFSLKKGE